MQQQLSFPILTECEVSAPRPIAKTQEKRAVKALNASSTLAEAMPRYKSYLEASGKSIHTVESFCSDIRKLMGMFPQHTLSEISTQDLREFLSYVTRKGAKEKTIYRKVTALKNFFRWLTADKILHLDPAATLVFKRVIPPLPDILSKDETFSFLEVSRESPLENVLAMLLLGAGLKRCELSSLTTDDIDVSDPLRPTVMVKEAEQYKQRNLDLPLDFVQAYQDYRERYNASGRLFECTGRNLNHIITCIAVRAGITKKSVTPQILRDTFAVRCLHAGDDIDNVLKKLGLARTTANEETRHKFRRLAEIYT